MTDPREIHDVRRARESFNVMSQHLLSGYEGDVGCLSLIIQHIIEYFGGHPRGRGRGWVHWFWSAFRGVTVLLLVTFSTVPFSVVVI